MTTIPCHLHGGPADGMVLPTAADWVTAHTVIYSVEGLSLPMPALYAQTDETDRYVFVGRISREAAIVYEADRRKEAHRRIGQ